MADITTSKSQNSIDKREIKFVIASNPKQLDLVYKVRYKSYFQRNETEERKDERFKDEFDDQRGTTNFLAICDGEVIGSIRTVISKNEVEKLPANVHFADILSQSKFSQSIILEGCRFCILKKYQQKLEVNSFLPFARIIAWVAYINDVDFVITAPHTHHRELYEKLMKFECLSDERAYAGVNFKTFLMSAEWEKFMKNMFDDQPDLYKFIFEETINLSCTL